MEVYSLFEGRHDIPENKGAILSSFDFSEFRNVPNPQVYMHAMEATHLGIIVTGLTPALTELLKERQEYKPEGSITLFHFDKGSKGYRAIVFYDGRNLSSYGKRVKATTNRLKIALHSKG